MTDALGAVVLLAVSVVGFGSMFLAVMGVLTVLLDRLQSASAETLGGRVLQASLLTVSGVVIVIALALVFLLLAALQDIAGSVLR